ncbi:TPA: hypothetical protein DCX15_06340 [bacterium]|nr:hypothetical protein [bacterium]
MKILSFILSGPPGNRPLPDECNLAFKRMDYELETITLSPQNGLIVITSELIDKIRIINPDVFFSVNYFNGVGKLSKILKLPYISWMGDNPLYYLKKEDISDYLILFVWEKVYIAELKALGFKKVHYLPLATNPERFKRLRNEDEKIKRYRCDISFVGSSLYQHYEAYESYIRRPDLNPEVQEILKKTVDIQAQNPTFDISNILEGVQMASSSFLTFKEHREEMDKLKTMLQLAAMAKYRRECAEEVFSLGLHLYGDQGWLKWSNNKIKYRGSISYYDLHKLYNASKINLNITVAQARSSLNQRPFDVSACGAFLLTDYRSELGNLFNLGKEVVCYQNKDELKDMAEYFIDHPNEREEIAQRAQSRVLREHTFEKRFEEMMYVVFEGGGRDG